MSDWGGPEQLTVVETLVADPNAGEVRVEVHAAAVNYPDLLLMANSYQVAVPLPFTPGSEFSGKVSAVGQGVDRVAVGDRVCGVMQHGAFSEQVVVPQDVLRPAPPGLSWIEAAAHGVTFGAAYYAAVTYGAATRGQTVLVIGAAGGVGSAAVQMCVALGLDVIGVVPNSESATFVMSLGACHALVHGGAGLRSQLKDVAPHGVDLVIDMVSGDAAEAALRSLAWGGRYVVVGFASGTIASLPLNLILLKGAVVTGFEARVMPERRPEEVERAATAIATFIAHGMRPAIDSVHPLADVAVAAERVQSGRALGKVVVSMIS
jgi:NADPH2:quinone reductase